MKYGQKVVVFGASGQLGRQLVATLDRTGVWAVVPSTREMLDIRASAAVDRFLRSERPSWVANCAAFTDVDRCEIDPDAQAINVNAVATLVDSCTATGARLLQVSTDYVFDGRGTRPYREADETAPLNAYGRTKLAGEELARRLPQHLVVRTSWLHGPGSRNFLDLVMRRAIGGEPVRVVNDQRGSPSFAVDVATGLATLMRMEAHGVYHVANAGDATWYELACAALSEVAADIDVVPISSREYGSPTRRPAYTVLDTSRYTRTTGQKFQHWRDALRVFVRAHLRHVRGDDDRAPEDRLRG